MPLTDPVPSSAFDVLERNIQDTDKFVNQESGTFTNRVGKVIKPIPVIESESNAAVISLGWHQVGLFADGFTYTLQNDIAKDAAGDWYRWNGSLPKIVTAGTLPSSDANFVKIDYKSHAELSDRNPADGSAHNTNDIGRGVVNLEQSLQSIESSISANDLIAINQINADRILSKIKANIERGAAPWGQKSPINMLGDSMSYGYFASYSGGVATSGGHYYHRFASILARMFAAEFNNGHYITCNPNLGEYANDKEIFNLTGSTSGAWITKNTGEYTSNLLCGAAFTTVTFNAYIEYTIPANFKDCWIHYVKKPLGGELTISQNGVVTHTIDTSNATLTTGVARILLVSNNQGSCVLRLTKTDNNSNEVGISAVSPSAGLLDDTTTSNGGGLNVFAAGGRRLQDLSEQVISDATNQAAALILALGFNDNALNGSGQEVGRAAFTQRINWIIQYCTTNNTPLIVPDFSWKNTADQFTRTQLKRAADECGGIYIPFPDMIKEGSFPTEEYRLLSDMWHDPAHPNKKGHKWIAETIAKLIGLGVNTKHNAISYHDYWVALPLDAAYKNVLINIPRNLSAYRIVAGKIHIRTQIALTAGGSFSLGLHSICGVSGTMFRIVPPVLLNSWVLTKEFECSETDGAERAKCVFYGTGFLQLIELVARTAINGTASFEYDKLKSN